MNKDKEPVTKKKAYRIYYHKGLKKYMVNIWFCGENIHIGYYTTFDEAVIERDKALQELYGKEGMSTILEKNKSKKRRTKFDIIKDELKHRNKPTLEEKKILDKAKEITQEDIFKVL